MSAVSKRRRASSSSPPSAGGKAPRAAVACVRCRTKKLRCVGGAPCSSCKAAQADCAFDLGAEKLDKYLSGGDLQQRVLELETTVKAMTTRLEYLESPNRDLPTSAHLDEAQDTVSGITVASERMDESTSARLHAATAPRPGYVPPFPPLMYHPSIWENRSRSPSPEGADPDCNTRLGPTLYEARVGIRDDPITSGYLTMCQANALYQFFFQLCLPAFPVMPMKHKNDFNGIRQRSPFLFTVITAVACRTYRKHTHSFPRPDQPPISIASINDVGRMAHAHLGASLFRKQHQVADVQAILLLSMFVLTGLGQSPDQWMLSGHCCRVAYRIALDKAYKSIIPSMGVSDKENMTERWQTWLAWYSYDGLLSLGFGRPQVLPHLVLEEMAFVDAVLSLPHRTAENAAEARLTASLVQLSTLGRRLIAVTEGMTVDADCPVVVATLADLSRQLDHWFAAWIPETSSTESENIAEIYGHHVRLCISSIALNISLSTALAPILAHHIAAGESAATSLIKSQGALYTTRNVMLTDYARLTFAQAGVFLLRLVLPVVPFDIGREAHIRSIRQSHEYFSSYDSTENGADHYFARILSEFCRASDIELQVNSTDEDFLNTPFDLDWLFAGQSTVEGAMDINQVFGVPLPAEWTFGMP